MAEKNVLAYFKSREEAELVKRQLAGMGVKELRIDRFHRFPGDGTGRLANTPSLSASTLGLEEAGPDVRTLMAADDSRMSNSYEAVSGYDILLTAVVDETVYHQILQRIRAAGGVV